MVFSCPATVMRCHLWIVFELHCTFDCLYIHLALLFITGVKGAQVEEIYDLSKPFKGCVYGAEI